MANDTIVSSTSTSTTTDEKVERKHPPLTSERLPLLFGDAVARNLAKGQTPAQAIDRAKSWLGRLIFNAPEQEQGGLRKQLKSLSWNAEAHEKAVLRVWNAAKAPADGGALSPEAETYFQILAARAEEAVAAMERLVESVPPPSPKRAPAKPEKSSAPKGATPGPVPPLTQRSIPAILDLVPSFRDKGRVAQRMAERIRQETCAEDQYGLFAALYAARPLPPPIRLDQVEASLRKDPSLRNVERLIAFIKLEDRLSEQEKVPLFEVVRSRVETHFQKGAQGLTEINNALVEAGRWWRDRTDPPKPTPRREEKAASRPPTPPRTGSAGFAAKYGKKAQLPTTGGGGNQTLH